MMKRKAVFILLLALLFLMGCVQEVSSTMSVVTDTVIYFSAEEGEKTSTPVITNSAMQVTISAISDETPTITMELFEERNQWLKNFYEGIEGCDFPCVGDNALIVGQTELTKAISNLSFGFLTEGFDENVDNKLVKYRFKPDSEFYPHQYSGLTIVGKNQKVYSVYYLYHSTLSRFLDQYGVPDEVWGWAVSMFSQGEGTYQIAMLYEDEGILVGFYGYTGKALFMDICEPQLDTGRLHVFLFDPFSSTKNIVDEIYSDDHPLYDLPAKNGFPLEDISNIDTENFYKMFLNSNPSNCFSIMDAEIYNGDHDVDTQNIVYPTPIVLD